MTLKLTLLVGEENYGVDHGADVEVTPDDLKLPAAIFVNRFLLPAVAQILYAVGSHAVE